MIEINLIPDVKQELIRSQRARTKVITISILAGIFSIGVVVLLAVYVFGVQTVRSLAYDSTIDSESKKLVEVKDLSKTLTIQNQLTKISALNDTKGVYSRLFDMLSAIIPPEPNNSTLSDLQIDSSTGTFRVNGQATAGYAALEVFKKTINGASVRYTDESGDQEVPLATNISTSNTSYGEDASGQRVLRFTLTFSYAPELFSPLSKNVSVVITTNGNVTDSYVGLPDIFADRASDLVEGQ